MIDDFCLRLKRHVLVDAQGFCKVTETICEGCRWEDESGKKQLETYVRSHTLWNPQKKWVQLP